MKIAIVGEAWNESDEAAKLSFQGTTGWCLTKMLEEAGIARSECYLTSVFNIVPRGKVNDVEVFCAPAGEVKNDLPALRAGKYLKDEYLPELDRLYAELREVKPNVIVAAGNTAAWALLGNSGIRKIRGTIAASIIPGLGKVIPAYHPNAILREWNLRHVTVLDLMKAKRESAFPEIRRPFRKVFIEPTLRELEWFFTEYLEHAERIVFDIETDPSNGQITCIGFAPSPKVAIVIPFCRGKTIASGSYWQTLEDELAALGIVRRILALPCPKAGQNGIYDLTWIWSKLGIATANYADDTMILHHALYPESEKGLGFLGSVYTNEASWKLMNRGFKKGDDE